MKKGQQVITKTSAVFYPDAAHAQFKLDGVLINRGEQGEIVAVNRTMRNAQVKVKSVAAWLSFAELTPL